MLQAPSPSGVFSPSCGSLTTRRHPNSTSISSLTTMRLISIPRSPLGSPKDRATIFTSRPRPPHGSTRWSAGSASSVNAPSNAARSKASPNSSRQLRPSSHSTMHPLPPFIWVATAEVDLRQARTPIHAYFRDTTLGRRATPVRRRDTPVVHNTVRACRPAATAGRRHPASSPDGLP